MKIDMLVVFAIVVGLVAVPYALLIIFGSGSTKKVASRIKAEAAKSGLTINQEEKWSAREIAVDTNKNKLLFGQMVENQLVFKQIDLDGVSRVNIVDHVATKKIDGKVQNTLEKVSLELIAQANAEPIVLNFYDSLVDAAQNFEMNRAQKWKSLLEAQLVSQPQKRAFIAA